MLQPVIIVFKGIACIIRRVYAGALYLPCKVLLKRFQGKEIVAIDKHILTILIPIRLFRVFNQYARLQLRLIFLAYPCEFKFLFFGLHHLYCSNCFFSSSLLGRYNWYFCANICSLFLGKVISTRAFFLSLHKMIPIVLFSYSAFT